MTQTELVIEFGKAARFDNGKGLFLPTTIDNIEFQDLRRQILVGLIDNPREQEPHITLMHPRNSTCTDVIFETILKHNLPSKLHFNKISLIEQALGAEWEILKEYKLKTKN